MPGRELTEYFEKRKELQMLLAETADLDTRRAIFNAAALGYWAEGAPVPPRTEDLVIPTKTGGISARIAYPTGAHRVPALVFAHGGGWVQGSLADDAYLQGMLSQQPGIAVVSLNYRLAPEHPFPAAIDDFEAVVSWVRNVGESKGIAPDKIAVGGASSGANIALASTMDQRDAGGVLPVAMALFYGVYGCDFETKSYRESNIEDLKLERATMKSFFEQYTGGGAVPYSHPLVTPLNGELDRLPPTWLASAGIDVLRDDSFLLGQCMRRAGVSVIEQVYDDLPHGFVSRARMLTGARRAIKDCKLYLQRLFKS